MFSEKHVRLFSETRTRIYENTYVFFQKDDGDIQAIRILYNKPNNQLLMKNMPILRIESKDRNQ